MEGEGHRTGMEPARRNEQLLATQVTHLSRQFPASWDTTCKSPEPDPTSWLKMAGDNSIGLDGYREIARVSDVLGRLRIHGPLSAARWETTTLTSTIDTNARSVVSIKGPPDPSTKR